MALSFPQLGLTSRWLFVEEIVFPFAWASPALQVCRVGRGSKSGLFFFSCPYFKVFVQSQRIPPETGFAREEALKNAAATVAAPETPSWEKVLFSPGDWGQGLRVPQHMALGFAVLWLIGFSPRSCPRVSVALRGEEREVMENVLK